MSEGTAAKDPQQAQKNYQQFLQILPLTVAIAGLPQADLGKYFNEDQLEVRAKNLRAAYKQARRLLRQVAEGSD